MGHGFRTNGISIRTFLTEGDDLTLSPWLIGEYFNPHLPHRR